MTFVDKGGGARNVRTDSSVSGPAGNSTSSADFLILAPRCRIGVTVIRDNERVGVTTRTRRDELAPADGGSDYRFPSPPLIPRKSQSDWFPGLRVLVDNGITAII